MSIRSKNHIKGGIGTSCIIEKVPSKAKEKRISCYMCENCICGDMCKIKNIMIYDLGYDYWKFCGYFKRNVIMNKAGGKSGSGTYYYKLSLPAQVIKELGVTPDDRGLLLYLENRKLIIERDTSDDE